MTPLIKTLGDSTLTCGSSSLSSLSKSFTQRKHFRPVKKLINDQKRIHFDDLIPVSGAAREAESTLR